MNPLGKRIFIVMEAPKEVETVGKIQTEAKPVVLKPTIGVIKKVGNEVVDFKEGDRVYVGEFVPEPQNIDGEMYIVIDESKIIAR